MTVTEGLETALRMIADPAHWCQEVYGRDVNGYKCNPTDEKCVKRRVMGALRVVDWSNPLFVAMQNALSATALLPGCILRSNDMIGHAEITPWFDRAIEASRITITKSAD
jgi:hypothetical protein